MSSDGCKWGGDCDNCPADDCIASWREAFKFYAMEEEECRKRYSRESVKKAQIQQRKNEYFWMGEAKWI